MMAHVGLKHRQVEGHVEFNDTEIPCRLEHVSPTANLIPCQSCPRPKGYLNEDRLTGSSGGRQSPICAEAIEINVG